MLRKHTKKLRLGTDTIRVLTRLQTARAHGGKIPVTVEPCTSTGSPTIVNCDATDGCPDAR